MTASQSQPPLLAPTACALDMPVRLALDRLASGGAEGFRAVQLSATHPELRPRELDGSARRGLRATLRRLELELAGLDAWIPARHWTDPAKVDRAFTSMCEIISLAADLIPHRPGPRLSVLLPRLEKPDAAGEAKRVIDAVIERGMREGVMLVDHALPPPPLGADSAAAFGLDAAAAIASGLDPAQLVAQHPTPPLMGVRLADLMRSGVRGLLGDKLEGQLDVLNLKIALSVAGYIHPIVIDTRQWPDPWAGLIQTAKVWRETATV